MEITLQKESHSCRVCLDRKLKMNKIFDGEKYEIVEKILYCTGLKWAEDDGLPAQICNTCLNNLIASHKFKTLCIDSDKILRIERPSIQMKKEKSSDSEDYFNTIHEYEFADVKEETEDAKRGTEMKNELQDNVKRSSKKLSKKCTDTREANKQLRLERAKKCKLKKLHCDTCSIQFQTLQEFRKHKKSVHHCYEWMCEVCGKVFKYQTASSTHMRSHRDPAYGCAHCDYKTFYKSDLIKHIRVHMGIKLFQCEFCSCSYHTSSNLWTHIRRHHGAETKSHRCHMCSKTFYDTTHLNRHLDTHNEIKRFECDVCQARFSRRGHWKKHLLRQHGVRVPTQRPGRKRAEDIIKQTLIEHGEGGDPTRHQEVNGMYHNKTLEN